jgi:hypothetical protein
MERVRHSAPGKRVEIVERQGGRKVSKVLMEFADPWLDEARGDHQRKIVVGMAVIA